MNRSGAASAIGLLLRRRTLRVLLVAAPGLTAAVAVLIATETNLVLAIVLNAVAGIIISSVVFIAVSMAAHRVADERVGLVRAAEQGFWQGRAQLLAIHHEESGLYTDWYFHARLQEEIERSQRYGLHLAVLRVKLSELHRNALAEEAKDWFSNHILRHLRRSDLVAFLQDGSLGILLPNTGTRAAEQVQRRLAKALASVDAQVGHACFPEDSEEPKELLAAASRAATEQARTKAA